MNECLSEYLLLLVDLASATVGGCIAMSTRSTSMLFVVDQVADAFLFGPLIVLVCVAAKYRTVHDHL